MSDNITSKVQLLHLSIYGMSSCQQYKHAVQFLN